eukprot:tig00000073_g1700.t1
MPRGVKKENLPEKICLVCRRPMTWRKKWEKNWDEVKYCSDKCRSMKDKADPDAPPVPVERPKSRKAH